MSSEHISKTKRTSCAAPSTRRSVQFLAALYIDALALVILVVFSRKRVLHDDSYYALAIASLSHLIQKNLLYACVAAK